VAVCTYIVPTDTSAGIHLYKTWVGKTIIRNASIPTGRLIGVAGAVAEQCWLCRRSPNDYADCLDEGFWEDRNAMSETDWKMTLTPPANPNIRFMEAVRRVYVLLNAKDGAMWPTLCKTARRLFVDMAVENEDVWRVGS
jgi:hypothetical protein